jgi:hypothetical protein
MVEYPTEEMIKAGCDMAEEMMDAHITHSFGDLGGGDPDMSRFSPLALRYAIEDDFTSVTGIYLAMEAVRNN